jgi:quinol monooxygenase YgiN
MFQTIAIHDVRPDHRDAFLAFMRRVEEAVAGAEGLIDFGSYDDASSGRLVGVGRWVSREAFTAALPQITSLGAERRDEWTDEDDVLLTLVPPAR